MTSFDDKDYVVVWAFDTPIMSGSDERAADLRNDFAAAVATAKQLYPREFERSAITEYMDHTAYNIEFKTKVADTQFTNMHTVIWDMMDRQMKKITGRNWKLKYSCKTRSSAWGEE